MSTQQQSTTHQKLFSKSVNFLTFIVKRPKTDFKVGDKAPLAHSDVRKFPEWWKPYGFNYFSDGYMLLAFATFAIFGWSYINDICEQKGRKHRKVFYSTLPTPLEKMKR
jgi:hypothetical protein